MYVTLIDGYAEPVPNINYIQDILDQKKYHSTRTMVFIHSLKLNKDDYSFFPFHPLLINHIS